MDFDTAIGGACNRFPSTHPSLIEAMAAGLSSDALDRVIGIYWKPVYKFIRVKFGKSNEDAKDLTQGFFTTALQRDFFGRFDPTRASFRTYLRMAVERFTANQHVAAKRQKRGGHINFETVEEQVAAAESPEQTFEREWQRQLFTLAIDDLRAHCDAGSKQTQFCIFRDYDLAANKRPSYAELAVSYGVSEATVTNYLAWARRTLRGFVAERVRGTTSGAQELHEEMRRIWT